MSRKKRRTPYIINGLLYGGGKKDTTEIVIHEGRFSFQYIPVQPREEKKMETMKEKKKGLYRGKKR